MDEKPIPSRLKRTSFSVSLKIPEQSEIFLAAYKKYWKDNDITEQTAGKTTFFLDLCKMFASPNYTVDEKDKVIQDLMQVRSNVEADLVKTKSQLEDLSFKADTEGTNHAEALQSLNNHITELELQLQAANEKQGNDHSLSLDLSSDDMQTVNRAMLRYMNENPGSSPEIFFWKLFVFTRTNSRSTALHD